MLGESRRSILSSPLGCSSQLRAAGLAASSGPSFLKKQEAMSKAMSRRKQRYICDLPLTFFLFAVQLKSERIKINVSPIGSRSRQAKPMDSTISTVPESHEA